MSVRHLLLAVTGMSPQIITETLYGLLQRGSPMPQRLRLITTLKGAERLRETLMGETGQLARFCLDYDLPRIPLAEGDIRIITDAKGREVDDARSEADHIAMADFIVQELRSLTRDPELAIHASLAGGRKTMTFLLGYAMSLFGRPQDALSHVLVSQAFEHHPQFFYPTPHDCWLPAGAGKPDINSREARVSLADIPFVRMREGMPTQLLEQEKLSYSEAVERLNLARERHHLILSPAERTLGFAGKQVLLTAKEMAFYCWLADAKRQGLGVEVPVEGEQNVAFARDYLGWALVCGLDQRGFSPFGVELLGNRLRPLDGRRGIIGMDRAFFTQTKSKVNKRLRDALGEGLAQPLLLRRQNRGGRLCHGLSLDADLITMPGIRPRL